MVKDKPLVLIVDDNESNLRLLEDMLSIDSYQCIRAVNGESALDILKNTPGIDLIVLDVMMPGVDGFEVCSRIKKNKAYRGIPVILLTALTDDESQRKAFEAGATDFISKPLKKELINARIKTHLALSLVVLEKEKLIWALNKTIRKISRFWVISGVLFILWIASILWIIYRELI